MCAPMITTSCARSVPGISAMRVDAVRLRAFGMERGLDVHLHPHRRPAIEQPHQAVVVLDGERGRRHLRRRLRVAAAAAGREDGAAVGHLRAPREVAAARRRVVVAAAFEQHAHAFLAPGTSGSPPPAAVGLWRPRPRSAAGAGAGRRLHGRGGFGPPRAVVHAQDHRTLEHAHRARCGCITTIFPRSVPAYFAKSASLRDLHAHHVAGDGAGALTASSCAARR